MKHAELAAALDRERRIEAMQTGWNVGRVDARDGHATDDHRADHDGHHVSEPGRLDLDRHAAILHEKPGDVALADGIDGIKIAGDAPDGHDPTGDRGVDAVVVPGGEVHDPELAAAVAIGQDRIADQVAH